MYRVKCRRMPLQATDQPPNAQITRKHSREERRLPDQLADEVVSQAGDAHGLLKHVAHSRLLHTQGVLGAAQTSVSNKKPNNDKTHGSGQRSQGSGLRPAHRFPGLIRGKFISMNSLKLSVTSPAAQSVQTDRRPKPVAVAGRAASGGTF